MTGMSDFCITQSKTVNANFQERRTQMAGLNKMTIIGNLGRDPEVRYTPDGLAVTNFTVAVNERVKGEDRTIWFKVVAFGRTGEVCGEYLSKGRQVYVEGQLRPDEWEDRDGNKRFSLEITASKVVFLSGKGDAGSGSDYGSGRDHSYQRPSQPAPQPPQGNNAPSSPQDPPDDDIPF